MESNGQVMDKLVVLIEVDIPDRERTEAEATAAADAVVDAIGKVMEVGSTWQYVGWVKE